MEILNIKKLRKVISCVYILSLLIICSCKKYSDDDDKVIIKNEDESKNKKEIIDINLSKENLPVKEIKMGKDNQNEINLNKSISTINKQNKTVNKKIQKIRNITTLTNIELLKQSKKINIYKNGRRIKGNYKKLFLILTKERFEDSYLLQIGKTKYKILKKVYKNKGIYSFELKDINQKKKLKRKFIIDINSDGIPDNEQINKKLIAQEELFSTNPLNKYIPLMQKHYVLENNEKQFVIIKKYINGLPLKSLFLKENNKCLNKKNNYSRIKKSLYQFIRFIIKISKQGIIMKNLNLNLIVSPKNYKEKNSIKIVGGNILKINEPDKEKSLKENIKNLNMIWYWQDRSTKFKNSNNKIDINDMPPVSSEELSSKIYKIAKNEIINMPKMNKCETFMFHSFIKTLLHISEKSKEFVNVDSKKLKSTFVEILKKHKNQSNNSKK